MKIIYLDQSVYQHAFSPTDRTPHKEFYRELGDLCLDLAGRRLASFPFSESHLRETSVLNDPDPSRRKNISNAIGKLSNGYRFIPSSGIFQTQATDLWRGLAADFSPLRAIHHDARFGFEELLLTSSDPSGRQSHHLMFKPVFDRWSKLTDSGLKAIASEEAQTYGRLLGSDLHKIVSGQSIDLLSLAGSPWIQLFSDLAKEARKNNSANPDEDAFRFIRECSGEIPCMKIQGVLWQHFAVVKKQSLHKEPDPASTAEDILFSSCFLPYCDAAFIEKKMAKYLEQSKAMANFKTELFSLGPKQNDFIEYLKKSEQDHVVHVSPKTFPTYQKSRLTYLRNHGKPALWITLLPESPDELIRPRRLISKNSSASVLEANILAGGGIEWIETLPKFNRRSSEELGTMLRKGLGCAFDLQGDGNFISMKICFSLVNCEGLTIGGPSSSETVRIDKVLFQLGISEWFTDGRNLLWPKPEELVLNLFHPKRTARRQQMEEE